MDRVEAVTAAILSCEWRPDTHRYSHYDYVDYFVNDIMQGYIGTRKDDPGNRYGVEAKIINVVHAGNGVTRKNFRTIEQAKLWIEEHVDD